MKLLVVTAWFYPFIHPRAHRWTEITAQWAREGHEVQVVTAKTLETKQSGLFRGVEVHRVGYDSLKECIYALLSLKSGRGRVGVMPRKPGLAEKALNWCYSHFWKQVYFPDDAMIWYYPAKNKIIQLIKNQSFDCIITVSLPFTGHLLGLAVKRKFPRLKWMADIGDPFSFQAKPPNNRCLYGRLNQKLEYKIIEMADTVCVTTKGLRKHYQELFHLPHFNHCRVIPPLAGREKSGLPLEPLATAFHIGYFGALYAPTRTPDALLELMDAIMEQAPEFSGKLLLHFWGEIFPEFYNLLSSRKYVILHGLRPRDEVAARMSEMDVLVSIGNITSFQLPSKTVDYHAANKPVLHLSFVADDPILEIMGNSPLLLALQLRSGKISGTDVTKCIRWLNNLPVATEMPDMEHYSIRAIAGSYLPGLAGDKTDSSNLR